jgi:hypothetical protein
MIFKTYPLKQRSYLQKLFGQHSPENAIIALNNLLATKPVTEITSAELKELETTYQTSLIEYRLNLEEFYAVYFHSVLDKYFLSDEDKLALRHLQHLLALDDRTINSLKDKIGEPIYQRAYESAISDGVLTEQENESLKTLKESIGLSDAITAKISEKARTHYIQNYFQKIIKDKRVSPKEEEDFKRVAENLKITTSLNEDSKALFEKYKSYWALENQSLPMVEVGIPLQKDEFCYFTLQNAEWYEPRVESRKYGTTYLKLLDKGTIYVTNKKLTIAGREKNYNIKIDSIVNIEASLDGLNINKLTGKSPTIRLSKNADILEIILNRLIKNRI